jgi:hypothetical protein
MEDRVPVAKEKESIPKHIKSMVKSYSIVFCGTISPKPTVSMVLIVK